MTTSITVRNLDPETQRILKHRAVDHGQSFEAEIRSILRAAARQDQPTADLFDAMAHFRRATADIDFTVPERTPEQPREVFS